MSFIYSETAKSEFFVPYHRQNATAGYVRHYGNSLELSFIMKRTNRAAERIQASKELAIAERKMAYFLKHPNYDHKAALIEVQALKSKWAGT